MASFSTFLTKPPLFTLNSYPILPQLLHKSPISSFKRPIYSHFDSGSLRLGCKVFNSKPIYGFGQMDSLYGAGTINQDLIVTKSAGTDQGQPAFGFSIVVKILHLAVSLGIILASDKLLKKAFVAASIKFPSALFGMFCVFSVLIVFDSVVPAAATSLMNFFEPATLFIQRYLPLFYVPSLVVLPLAVRDVPAASGLKICFITGLFYVPCLPKFNK